MKYLFFILLFVMLSCTESDPINLGQEGDSCIDIACDSGLICKDDICEIDQNNDKCKDIECNQNETCNPSTGVCEENDEDKCKDIKCEASKICNPSTGVCEDFKSSDGINLAISSGENEKLYKIINSPLLFKGKLYTQLFRDVTIDEERALKVVSYDLSKFTSDTTLESLLDKTIYEQVGPNFSDSNFNTRLYPPEEIDNMLYFETLPKKEAKGQNCFTKYDLDNEVEVYHVENTPVQGEDLNTTFDLARGFFIPFNDNQNIAITEDAMIRVINPADGLSYKYGQYDYLSNGLWGGSYTNQKAFPSNETSLFVGDGIKFVATTFLADPQYVEYGSRNINDPKYKEKDIFVDFMGKYTGDKQYTKLSSKESSFSMIIHDNNIYFFVGLVYENKDGGIYDKKDLYLLRYDTDANLQDITFIDTDNNIMFAEITNLYKYNENLYFRYKTTDKEELCAYNILEKKFKFRYEIGTSALYSANLVNTYVITGDTIIIPEISYQNESYVYDIVFKIIDINDGKVIKTLRHKDLRNLSEDNRTTLKFSFSDKDAVYFVGENKKDKIIKNIIVKIDSNNKIEKSRARFDNHHTGIVK